MMKLTKEKNTKVVESTTTTLSSSAVTTSSSESPYAASTTSSAPSAPLPQSLEDVGDFDHKINIVLLGNKGCGKSSLLFKLGCGMFSMPYIPTVGADFVKTVIMTHDGQVVEVKFWDTSGDIRTKESIASYVYPTAAGFIVMYDICDIQSYNDVFHWMRLVDNYAPDNAKVVIVGNKVDLRDDVKIAEDLQVSKRDGMECAFCYKVKFMETSVYTNHNLEKTIRRLVTMICQTFSDNKGNGKKGGGIMKKKEKRLSFSLQAKDSSSGDMSDCSTIISSDKSSTTDSGIPDSMNVGKSGIEGTSDSACSDNSTPVLKKSNLRSGSNSDSGSGSNTWISSKSSKSSTPMSATSKFSSKSSTKSLTTTPPKSLVTASKQSNKLTASSKRFPGTCTT